ncbi:MAG: site-specific DNA-methyltransferase [Campylobacteraceae bacterium]|jgi:adenine-specific DNA-methyltransferase|nr:site-specific DNA-methyltransferase [Campylobacteraceae bacterium]
MMIAPDCEHNEKPENKNSGNIFITGDNLEALRHLQNAYANKIKMIYIDPPYNTGQEFTYSDKFEFDDEKLKSALGYSDDEIARLKSIQGKSSHSAWLTFMYPRLKIAQKLLSNDGVIFISIDDNEQANLKLLMDDVFGEGNFIGEFIAISAPAGTQSSSDVAQQHSYCISYKKKFDCVLSRIIPTVKTLNEKYNEEDEFGKYYVERLWKRGIGGRKEDVPSLHFPVYYDKKTKAIFVDNETSDTEGLIKIIPYQAKGILGRWTWSKEKMKKEREKLIVKKIANEWKLHKKQYIDSEIGKLANTIIDSKIARTELGSLELKKIMNEKVFDYPKYSKFVQYFLQFGPSDNSIILDFFAGSGTTAHAVMQLNAEDGGNRKFILVQLDEPTNHGSEARKAGYNTIDEIARERIKRAAQKIKTEAGLNACNLDCGFKHFRLTNPDVKTIDKIIEFDPNNASLFDDDMITPFAHSATKTSGLDTLLATWLINDGFTFDVYAETINFAKYQAYYIKDAAMLYLINQGWDTEALKALLNQIGKNEICVNIIVVYPYSFSFEAMCELKTNIKTILDNSPTIIERY